MIAKFKMSDNVGVQLEDEVSIYVDGACRNNGQTEAKGGCGVYWGDGHPMNCSEVLLGEKQTNNRAEMSAAIIALSQAIAEGLTNITIISDSRYMKEGISNWIKKWKINGWKSQTKTDILNKDLWVLLDSLRNKVNVTWKWVEGHGTTQGNIEADRLAGIGVSESSSFWQKCAICPGLEESIILPTKSNVRSAKTTEMEVSNTPKEEERTMCSFCNKDSPGKTIQCSECKSTCHYLCTRLPRYQLYALHNTHRKYSCEKCLKIPESFAIDIEDEVSLRINVPEEKLSDKSPEVSEMNKHYFKESLSKNNDTMREMLQTFQTTTIHALESAFVNAIEKLGSTKVDSKENDQQSQIQQLLQEKDRLLKEKENLIKSVKSSRTDTVNSASNLQTNTMQIELQRLTKERDHIQMNLHKTTTELEVCKSKLQTETSVWRQKLDAMTSRNDILGNESVRLEKMLSLKNEDISELENSKRELKKQIESLQSDVLSLKLHESRADDALIQAEIPETLDTSVVIVDDKGASSGKVSYSEILTSDANKNKTRPSVIQPNSSPQSENRNDRENALNSNDGRRNEQTNNMPLTERKDKVILIGTSNVRYLSSRYIAGNSYYVHKEIKYTVGEAKSYVDSLDGNENISKFILHLSCNDIKSVSAESHATSYCDLVKQIHDKYPEAYVIVSLGLPRKDRLLSNKIEVSNGLIKEKLFSIEKTTICDNSNLAFRGTPVFGVLEDDGVHISRRGFSF